MISGLAEADALSNVKVTPEPQMGTGSHLWEGFGSYSQSGPLQSARVGLRTVTKIHFDEMHYRRDIGRAGLKKQSGMASVR